MSLMTDIQGTPERVWSLLNLIHAHGGEITRVAVKQWLDPFDSDPKDTAVTNTIGAATSLGLVSSSARAMKSELPECPKDLSAFSDLVHSRLAQVTSDHGDSVVLEAFAWFVARCAKESGTTWISQHSTNELCDLIRHDITVGTDDKRFNTTRYPRWRDWIGFIGLGVDIPGKGTTSFYPYVTECLEKQISSLQAQLGTNKLEGQAFLAAISKAMPYLDGGPLFEVAAKRIKWTPSPRQLSPVLSIALRDLHDEQIVELVMHGDARDAYTLAHDPTHKMRAFRTVVLQTQHG